MRHVVPHDPFSRGSFAVGVRAVQLRDASRDRPLPVELWYPAVDAERGRDLDPASRDHFEVLLYVVRTSQTIGSFFVETVLAPVCGQAALCRFSSPLRSNVKRLIFSLRSRNPLSDHRANRSKLG